MFQQGGAGHFKVLFGNLGRHAAAAARRWQQRVQKLVEKNQTDSRHLAKVMMVKYRSMSVLVNTLMKHMPITAMTKSIVESMAALVLVDLALRQKMRDNETV